MSSVVRGSRKSDLRIGIDGCVLAQTRTGIGRYVFELCKALDVAMPSARFFVYSRSEIVRPVNSERWVYRVDSGPWSLIPKTIAWLKLRCGALATRDNVDAFWATGTFCPRLPKHVRLVSTVYDLNHEIVPETMQRGRLLTYRMLFAKDVKRAGTVIAISHGTSKRMGEYLGRSADAVVFPAVDKSFNPQTANKIRGCLDQYRITQPYLLAVGTHEPRKNLELLVRTFLQMKRQGLLREHQLVLVGKPGWKTERLASLIDSGRSFGVMPLGFVPDNHLPSLYSGCDAFILPSLYEGFGLPALEARACGAKVIVSDVPELTEAAGPNAICIPRTADGISQGILAATSRIEKPRDDLQLPDWNDGAAILADALSGMLTSAGLHSCQAQNISALPKVLDLR